MTAEPYDRGFFEGQEAASLRSAQIVLGRLFPMLQPSRVLDVGCGTGPWMRAALELGAADVLGVDGDYVDRQALLVDPALFIPGDLATRSVRDVLGSRADQSFDLVVCMEVAEHLPFDRAPSLVADLAGLADAVLFSAAVPFQFGTNHINEQWPEFWSILFRGQGFACFDLLRPALWAASGVDWWYAQNALVFAREGSAAASRLPPEARSEGRGLAFVHPENLLANLLGLPRRHRLQAGQEEMQDLRALVAANLRHDRALPPLAAPARAAAFPTAADVFPATRMETYQPEQEIAALSRRLAETGEFLQASNAAYHQANDALERERAARQQVQDALQHARAELERLRDFPARLQAQGAARMLAETRAADLQAAATEARRDQAAVLAAERETIAADHATASAALDARAEEQDRRDRHLVAREQATEALRRSRTMRTTRRLLRLAGRIPAAEPGPLPVPPPPDPPQPPPEEEAGQPNRMEPIKRGGKLLGEVSPWVIEAATTRLKQFEAFDGEDYLRRNPDVAAAGLDPYRHFVQSGGLEGRGRVDPEDLARLMGSLMMFDSAVRSLPAEPAPEPDLPALVADVGPIGIFVSRSGNVFMNELAEDLATDLRSAGVSVDLLDETADIESRPPLCIYVAPHEFFTLGRGTEWIRDDVLTQGFCFGTEQVQTTWFNTALPFIMMSRGMLDICSQTAELFGRLYMAALHVLPGVRLRPHLLSDRDRTHPLFGVLPRAARVDADPGAPFRARPIDVSFFGAASPRRDQFFARNAAFFAQHEAFNYVRRPGRGPIREEGEDGVLTHLAAHVSAHSKIALNIHQEEFGYFEWHRMVRLGMCSGALVVSDPCLPHPSFIAGEHYLQESARHMPDLLEWLLTTEDGEREAERVRANVNTLITETYDTPRTVARLLQFFALYRSRERG